MNLNRFYRNVGLKNQRDHMRAMGQFVPDSEDEDEEDGQVGKVRL